MNEFCFVMQQTLFHAFQTFGMELKQQIQELVDKEKLTAKVTRGFVLEVE